MEGITFGVRAFRVKVLYKHFLMVLVSDPSLGFWSSFAISFSKTPVQGLQKPLTYKEKSIGFKVLALSTADIFDLLGASKRI